MDLEKAITRIYCRGRKHKCFSNWLRGAWSIGWRFKSWCV